MIETHRLLLRKWREDDKPAFAFINADAEVALWLGHLTRRQSDAAIDRYNACIEEKGFGRFAVERKDNGALIGAVGLMPVPANYPISGVEIGWRLSAQERGNGFATEAGHAALLYGFNRICLPEIIAYTALQNRSSIAVMKRLGMMHDPGRDFEHPAWGSKNPLLRQCVYVARVCRYRTSCAPSLPRT